MGWSVIWWDIARVGFCISRANGEWNTAHKCNVSPYNTPPHAMINLLYTNTKRDGYNIGNPGRSSYSGLARSLLSVPYHFGDWEYDPSGTGIDTKRLWPRGRYQFSVYVTAAKRHNASSACSAWRARLWEPSCSETPYTQPLTTKTRPARAAHVLP